MGDGVRGTLKVTTQTLISHTKASLWFPASTGERQTNDKTRALLFI